MKIMYPECMVESFALEPDMLFKQNVVYYQLIREVAHCMMLTLGVGCMSMFIFISHGGM